MKKSLQKSILLLIAIFNLGIASLLAQIPQAINFQAIARDADSNPMVNANIQIQLSVLDGSAQGTVIYQELRALQTNAYGSFSFQIGVGANYTPIGTFQNIAWESGNKFLKIDYDPSNTFTFDLTLGIIEFVSVPYAFAAETVVFIDATGAEEGDVLVYNSTSGKFEPSQEFSGIITWENVQNKPNFATVATTGNYPDLTNKPTISDIAAIDNNVNTQLKNVTDPTDTQDAVTKGYVDQIIQIMENNGLTVVDFTADDITTAVGSTVSFNDNSTINPTTWAWDFGDGNTATTQNPTHTYITAGTYTVSLTASNGLLTKTKTKTDYITVSLIVDGPGAGLSDIDGNTYTSIIIDGEEWMSENLRVTHYPNGDAIPLVSDNTAWSNLDDDNTSDAYSYYNNNASNEAETYGALYTYASAIGDNWTRDNVDNQGVCPDGWHLPTNAEWTTLTTYLGSDSSSKLAGNATLWTDGDLNQNPNFGTSGFSALPSGGRGCDFGTFNSLGDICYWWSAAEYSSLFANYITIYYDSTSIGIGNDSKSSGYSVRCVKD